MRELHLFAGIGGGILGGMLLGHVPVCAVELDKHCRKVLEARQLDGIFSPFPIFEDVRVFDGRPWRGKVDVVCGGFPCQPWSAAGKRLGAADPRHLWPEMARIVDEVRPRFVFAENVSLAAFAEPWRDLRGLGYRVPPALELGAVDVGAPHRRNRWWLLAADANQGGEHAGAVDAEVGGPQKPSVPDADRKQHEGGPYAKRGASSAKLPADADGSRLEKRDGCEASRRSRAAALERHWWAAEPRVGRVANGVPARVDRLRALGNAQVPSVAAAAFSLLMREHFPAG